MSAAGRTSALLIAFIVVVFAGVALPAWRDAAANDVLAVIGTLLDAVGRRDLLTLNTGSVTYWMHAGMHATICFVLLWLGVRWWVVLPTLVAFGALAELLQYYVPGRSPDIDDLGMNVLGIAVGLLSYGVIALVLQKIASTQDGSK